jgi:hypothetical protein
MVSMLFIEVMTRPPLALLQSLRGTKRSSLNICTRRIPSLKGYKSRNALSGNRFYATESPLLGASGPSSSTTAGSSNSRIRVSSLFTVLLCVGLGATVFGLYDVYNTLTMWPEEIRQDLRAAITAKNQGFLETSARYYSRCRSPFSICNAQTLT